MPKNDDVDDAVEEDEEDRQRLADRVLSGVEDASSSFLRRPRSCVVLVLALSAFVLRVRRRDGDGG